MKNDREYVQVKQDEMNLLRELINLKSNKCYYCKKIINFKKDKYSIFNKPNRLICDSILCMTEAISKDEDKK